MSAALQQDNTVLLNFILIIILAQHALTVTVEYFGGQSDGVANQISYQCNK